MPSASLLSKLHSNPTKHHNKILLLPGTTGTHTQALHGGGIFISLFDTFVSYSQNPPISDTSWCKHKWAVLHSFLHLLLDELNNCSPDSLLIKCRQCQPLGHGTQYNEFPRAVLYHLCSVGSTPEAVRPGTVFLSTHMLHGSLLELFFQALKT